MSEKYMDDQVVIRDGNQAKARITKTIGFFGAFSFTFGVIIGSGIFIGVGPTFDVFESTSIGMVVVFWVLGGLVALVGGLCYAELGTRIPESGGERAYYMVGLNQKFSVTYIFIYIFIVKAITLAALAVTTGSYLASIIFKNSPNLDLFVKIFAAGTLLISFIINCWSKNIANKTGILFTIIKMLALLLVISIGIYSMATKKLPEWKNPFYISGFDLFRFSLCLINLFWSYEGWNTLGLVAGDMKNPARDFPIAIVTGISLVMLFYVMAAVSYSATLGYDVVRVSETVASSMGVLVLKQGYIIIPLLISLSTFGSTNANFYAVGCVIASAGIRGDLPKIFSLVHATRRTPIIGLLVEFFLSLIFIMFKFQILLNYSSFISWFIYFISLCCLIRIKFIQKLEPNSKIFRIPIIFIIPMQIVCLYTVVMCFMMSPIGCGIFAGIIIFIFIIQYLPKKCTQCNICSRFHMNVIKWLTDSFNLLPATLEDIS